MRLIVLCIWLTLMLSGSLLQSGCGYVAAGAAGAAIGHEAAERRNRDRDRDDDDREDDE
jgi:hypothetical protein